jgi:hypothetical protein
LDGAGGGGLGGSGGGGFGRGEGLKRYAQLGRRIVVRLHRLGHRVEAPEGSLLDPAAGDAHVDLPILTDTHALDFAWAFRRRTRRARSRAADARQLFASGGGFLSTGI